MSGEENMIDNNNNLAATGVLCETDIVANASVDRTCDEALGERIYELKWINVLFYSGLVSFGISGLFAVISGRTMWQTNLLRE
jgi:hypothetical protein